MSQEHTDWERALAHEAKTSYQASLLQRHLVELDISNVPSTSRLLDELYAASVHWIHLRERRGEEQRILALYEFFVRCCVVVLVVAASQLLDGRSSALNADAVKTWGSMAATSASLGGLLEHVRGGGVHKKRLSSVTRQMKVLEDRALIICHDLELCQKHRQASGQDFLEAMAIISQDRTTIEAALNVTTANQDATQPIRPKNR